jgi:hypothetical protein
MRRDLPYAIIVPAVMVGFAVVLMIWAISGDSGPRMAGHEQAPATTGAAPRRANDSAIRSRAPRDDAASESVRAVKGTENNVH